MSRFGRQELIPEWDQARLADAHVAVCGRAWLGAYLVWALCLMGVGHITWLGRPRRHTRRLAEWLLAQPPRFEESTITAFPSDPVTELNLSWTLNTCRTAHGVFIDCTDDSRIASVCRNAMARNRDMTWLTGGLSSGGWYGTAIDQPTVIGTRDNLRDPVAAMAVAALLADAARARLCPLSSDLAASGGCLQWTVADPRNKLRPGAAILVGLGGIGTYVAMLLAARGHAQLAVDFDRVDQSNRNRQGLFSAAHVDQEALKVVAAQSALSQLFPTSRMISLVRRVDETFSSVVKRVRPKPHAILSAVDNADTRLVLSSLGAQFGLPVIQGGTDIFSADCITQRPQGASLDQQLYGALSDAAHREARQRKGPGRCVVDPSYVVPSMLAGAMMVRRFEQLLSESVQSQSTVYPPMRWRQSAMPTESKELSIVETEYDARLCEITD